MIVRALGKIAAPAQHGARPAAARDPNKADARALAMAAPSGAPPLHPHDSDEIFEPLSDDEDFISGSEWSQEEESDGELDWDPDRERLLRSLRQTGQARPPPRSSSAKSLAERRNEWRASRGLQKQKSVQEIIAERRAAREEGRQPPAW